MFVPYGAARRCSASGPSVIEPARGLNLSTSTGSTPTTIRELGPVEEVLNTPSHHRVHHGSNRRYLDRNHGSILIIWDRLFGTFEREDDDEPVVYGLTKNIDTFDPLRVATHEHADMLRDVARSTDLARPPRPRAAGPGLVARRRPGRRPRRRRLTGVGSPTSRVHPWGDRCSTR